jgi:large conductance mechanosensitive channel
MVQKGKFREEARELAHKEEARLAGFMDFIREHSVVGLAVGLAIGLSVTELVTAIVEGFINPMVGVILPSDNNLKEASFTLLGSEFLWGNILLNFINLIAVAALIYFVVKGIGLHRLDKKKDK